MNLHQQGPGKQRLHLKRQSENMKRNEQSSTEKAECGMADDWSQHGQQQDDPFVEQGRQPVVSKLSLMPQCCFDTQSTFWNLPFAFKNTRISVTASSASANQDRIADEPWKGADRVPTPSNTHTAPVRPLDTGGQAGIALPLDEGVESSRPGGTGGAGVVVGVVGRSEWWWRSSVGYVTASHSRPWLPRGPAVVASESWRSTRTLTQS